MNFHYVNIGKVSQLFPSQRINDQWWYQPQQCTNAVHVLNVFLHCLLNRLTKKNKRHSGFILCLSFNVILNPSANQIKLRSRAEKGLMQQQARERIEKQRRLRLAPHPVPSPSLCLGPNPLSWLFLSSQPFLYSIIKTHCTTCCLFH